MSPLQLGHAAITLADGTHISWWPTEKTEGKKSKKTPRDVGSLSEDVTLEGRRPDKTFEVTGLDENRINVWGESYLDAGENYNLVTRNCCNIVMNALRAGGFTRKYFLDLVYCMHYALSTLLPGTPMTPGGRGKNDPRSEKTGLRGFRPGPTQTRLCSH